MGEKRLFYNGRVLDPEKESVISAKTHAYNTDNNPLAGFKLGFVIDKVFLRGHLAVEDGELKQEKLRTFFKRLTVFAQMFPILLIVLPRQ